MAEVVVGHITESGQIIPFSRQIRRSVQARPDETGLVVQHEIDPEIKAALLEMQKTLTRRSTIIAVGGGVAGGFLLALLIWAIARSVKG